MNASNAGRTLAQKRWQNATKADRKLSAENGKLGGRPRGKSPRCPCGMMTLKCARVRSHHCCSNS